ncbi:L-threonate dehydrogenase [Ahrensia sp. R2A130]|uniref:L-threonate dehydrogenase n=1 Tax=Ahrensia sp. R2A130 TaxID=744979 RepID=UPI0001E0CA45|nr:L-threonate dehydrogenase [Ahrensia sp. R2A130]EFL87631.1 3-hydroxyisobutyrate dehydrogenase [Ahrensia sp. R2A130]
MKVAVVGLGSMGMGIARSTLAGGHEVWGYDLNAANAADFKSHGGGDGQLTDVAETLDCLVVVVLNADQLNAVLSDELLASMNGAVVIACATVPPQAARDTAQRCVDHGCLYLDAPMSGGAAKAMTGELSFIASGSRDAFAKAGPVLKAAGTTTFDLGDEPGAGSAMKAVNQMLAGVHIAAMGEALAFGLSQGIEIERIVDIIPQCAGTSWMFENRAPHVRDADYTPRSAVDIWPKDLGIVMDAAKASRVPTPLTAAAMQRFLAASGQGWGGDDDAAVTRVTAREAGLKLPGEE